MSMILTPTQSHFDQFAAITGDDNPIHIDPQFSAQHGFGRTVAHGAMLTMWLMAARGQLADLGTATSVIFPAPAFSDEALTIISEDNGMRAVRVSDGVDVCVLSQDPPLTLPQAVNTTYNNRPFKVGMMASKLLHITLEQSKGLRCALPLEISDRSLQRAIILGGWSALLGMTLPGRGTHYLKQQTLWHDLNDIYPDRDQPLILSVQVTQLRPTKSLIDLRTEAKSSDGASLASGRALVSAREVIGAW
jgi:hypothetical protein